MAAQRKRAESTKVKTCRAPRPEYTAAVRYLDGSRDIFRVRNADDMTDARALVLSELGEVRSLIIALRQH
jgi:hypothetical protein